MSLFLAIAFRGLIHQVNLRNVFTVLISVTTNSIVIFYATGSRVPKMTNSQVITTKKTIWPNFVQL